MRVAATTFTAIVDARRAFLGELIDDAGLFPPAQLSMPEALLAHERARTGPHAWMLGRFIVAASRLRELAETLDDGAGALRISVVIDGERSAGFAAIAKHAETGSRRLLVKSVELKLRNPSATTTGADEQMKIVLDAKEAAPAGAAVYFELDVSAGAAPEAALEAIARAAQSSESRIFAKIRCGGLVAEAIPAPARLAQVIKRAVELRVALKATAGLHHPLCRRQAEAGFTMHGFLNVIGAAVLASTLPVSESTIEAMIADEDPASFELDSTRLRWRDLSITAGEIGSARARTIHSYGSCSFDEPVEDLIALGILGSHEP